MEEIPITDPVHGGKVTCHKCNGFIFEGEEYQYNDCTWFHETCFNRYEHYYGLDKPID